MDHDSVPYKIDGPKSARPDEIRRVYREFASRGLMVMNDHIASEQAYMSNIEGHFAWDLAPLIRAACLMWRTTQDPWFLQLAAGWSEHLVCRTDEERNVRDWKGRSRPVWSSGPRYTAGTAQVASVDGEPIHIQACAESIKVELVEHDSARVHVEQSNGQSWVSPRGSLLPGNEAYLPDVLAERSAVLAVQFRGLRREEDLRGIAPGYHLLQNQLAPHLVHTGAIARALLETGYALSASARETVRTDISADDLIEAAERSLLCHDDEIRVRAGQAWYITPFDFPGRRLGLELPHNHVVDAATSFMLLGQEDGSRAANFFRLGKSLSSRFLRELSAYAAGHISHPWHYYPLDSDTYEGVERADPVFERTVQGVQRGEDSSHATSRVRALAEWKRLDDALVSDVMLTQAALALRRFYIASDGSRATLRWLPLESKAGPRFGAASTYAGAWGALSRWDESIRSRINSIAYWHPPTRIFGATVLSAAELFALNSSKMLVSDECRRISSHPF